MDDMMLSQIVGQLVMMALTGVIGWLGGKIKGAKSEREKSKQEEVEERDLTRAVMRLLLYYRICDLYESYVVNGDSISAGDKHEIEELYGYYKQLNGNGEGKRMYNELMQLKTV